MENASQDLVFRALAHARRREMLDLLKVKERTTGELCDHFKDMDRCTVMQHLGVLEKADLIIVQRKGRHRWNYLNALPILGIYDRWIHHYASSAVRIAARIKEELEG